VGRLAILLAFTAAGFAAAEASASRDVRSREQAERPESHFSA
jgi:hypothetical protein